MSPEIVGLDEVPDPSEDERLGSDIPANAVPCPECGEYFKSRGLTRHRVQTHGVTPPVRQGTAAASKTAAPKLAVQWAEFQRGAALFISFACAQCAAVIVEDADTDGIAIAAFCENRPKLRRQIQNALSGMDVMILVGALGGTARKMMAHHEIGKKIGLPGPSHSHAGQSAQEKMLSFLTQMPESDRNLLLNQVFNGMATASPSSSGPVAESTRVTVVMDDENTPGAPPPPEPINLTESDRFQMAMAHSGTDFDTTL